MSNQEILETAIIKAQDNGWQTESWHRVVRSDTLEVENLSDDGCFILRRNGSIDEVHINEIIFNHEFAKSLWPTKASGSVDPRAVSPSTARPLIPTWQARLMEMVIDTDPIAYLGRNI